MRAVLKPYREAEWCASGSMLTPGHVLLGKAQMRGCGCPAAVVSPEGHLYPLHQKQSAHQLEYRVGDQYNPSLIRP